jgi:hypothetical protein
MSAGFHFSSTFLLTLEKPAACTKSHHVIVSLTQVGVVSSNTAQTINRKFFVSEP